MALREDQVRRYSRHILLDEVGGAGQERLLGASALLVGAGGLGCPAGLYLAASGLGRIAVADPDRVDLTNLQRQIAHATADVGRPKVESLREALEALNPDVTVEAREEALRPQNVLEAISSVDVVLDGSDNFATRYMISDACRRAGRPLVSGAILRFEGQLTTFLPGPERPCYRCLFPEPPGPGCAARCSDSGVLGAVAGVVGSLMAAEALKVLLGRGEPLVGRLLLLDALAGEIRTVRYGKDPACVHDGPVPGTVSDAWHR